ncbi:cation transporter [Treponema sp.]|uniref:cation transporter n=1 Tax=Treponema sp. TaxID=166 RepID=UPI00298EAEB2|nr:cation transporter [Treponema sp.]MCR5613893.1 cation transporter [Treponema sp.]
MKKAYKIEVDCANCAAKMEEAAKKTEGVKDAVVNFMMLKMTVEFEEGADEKKVMKQVLKNCRKVEDDCEIEIDE